MTFSSVTVTRRPLDQDPQARGPTYTELKPSPARGNQQRIRSRKWRIKRERWNREQISNWHDLRHLLDLRIMSMFVRPPSWTIFEMKDQGKRIERLQIMLSAEELSALDDWRFVARMPSRSAAVRELLRRGLSAEGYFDEAAQGSRSKDFSILDGEDDV